MRYWWLDALDHSPQSVLGCFVVCCVFNRHTCNTPPPYLGLVLAFLSPFGVLLLGSAGCCSGAVRAVANSSTRRGRDVQEGGF